MLNRRIVRSRFNSITLLSGMLNNITLSLEKEDNGLKKVLNFVYKPLLEPQASITQILGCGYTPPPSPRIPFRYQSSNQLDSTSGLGRIPIQKS